MTKTIIEESRWYRGVGGVTSYLLRGDGTMCCLGFDCLRRGFTEDEIRQVGTPKTIKN